MAVESPRGNLVKDENMKITRRPPVMAMAARSHPILKMSSIHLFYPSIHLSYEIAGTWYSLTPTSFPSVLPIPWT